MDENKRNEQISYGVSGKVRLTWSKWKSSSNGYFTTSPNFIFYSNAKK